MMEQPAMYRYTVYSNLTHPTRKYIPIHCLLSIPNEHNACWHLQSVLRPLCSGPGSVCRKAGISRLGQIKTAHLTQGNGCYISAGYRGKCDKCG